MKNLILVAGGLSAERDISIKNAGYIKTFIKDRNVYLVYLLQDKSFVLENGEKVTFCLQNSKPFLIGENCKIAIDSLWPILYGDGENGVILGYFETLNIPYYGSGILSAALSFNKILCKRVLSTYGINVPKFVEYDENMNFEQIKNELGCEKIIVKPSESGSSLGISVVAHESEFKDAIALAKTYGHAVLIEEYLNRQHEVLCSIVGNEAFGIEVEYEGEIFSYENKYLSGRKNFAFPEVLSGIDMAFIEETALRIFNLLGCKFCSRLDFIVSSGKLYFIENNTMPGMSANSSFIKALEHKGISFEMFVNRLLKFI